MSSLYDLMLPDDIADLRRIMGWFRRGRGDGLDNPNLNKPTQVELPTFTFRNDASSIATASAIMAVTGIDKDSTDDHVFLKCDQPSASAAKFYVVNDVVDVPAKDGSLYSFGQCYLTGKCHFAYDTGTPALGDTYGPKASQWTATKDGSPGVLLCLGITDSTAKIAEGVLNCGASTQSKVISSATHSAVTTGTTSFSVSSCSTVEAGVGDDSSGSVTVYNVFAWAIDANGLVWAKWNQSTSHYELFQAKCPA